ncbi:aspartate aminotransferase family protein [Sanguibacter sp. Z1732]|uniref:aspartate aminotransferase family protein n=1 Tax=Sanguibacter sp. Z1732 TaxID=3435412 RepID=UPI003D9C92CE
MPSLSTATPVATAGEEKRRKAVRLIPGGVNSATRNVGYPAAFSHARGSTITDSDGREFVDYHCAFGATLLGHNDERVNAAVAETFGTIDLIGLGVTELEIQAAQLVQDLIPSVDMSITTMSGTESTFQAVRLARAATGRKYVLKFQGCFHGWHDAVARNVASSAEGAWGRDPLSAGILDDAIDATLIAEFNDLGSVQEVFDRYPDQIAAVILEPVPHNVGALLPIDAFLRGLRELCTTTGTVLIFDEVITGFRHAPGGYQELCGIAPDLTAYGKAMGNGFPVAGMGGRRDLMERFNSAGGDVMLAGTYNGNPRIHGSRRGHHDSD